MGSQRQRLLAALAPGIPSSHSTWPWKAAKLASSPAVPRAPDKLFPSELPPPSPPLFLLQHLCWTVNTGPICLRHVPGSLPATGSPSSSPALARCARGVAFTSVPLTLNQSSLCQGIAPASPAPSTLANPHQGRNSGGLGLSFLRSLLSQPSVDYSLCRLQHLATI